MIEKMMKYSFVLYHLDYNNFLTRLQDLGMVHLVRSCEDKSPELVQNRDLMTEYAEVVKYLTKLNSTSPKISINLPTKALLNKINGAREERESLVRHEETLKKNIRELLPWNHFDYELVRRIKESGIGIDFHYCLKNHFKPEWEQQYAISVIGERSGLLYFVVLYTGDSPALEADTFSFHQHTLQEFETDQTETLSKIKDIDEYLQNVAPAALEAFETEIRRLGSEYDYVDATLQGVSEADAHLRILSGWIPASKEAALKQFILAENVIHFSSPAQISDDPPVSLKNGWFARLFEPISKMYMLPKYGEFDLTPFLAPFFMLFFGFCNADIGYGIAIIAIALFMRWKSKNDTVKGFMSLILLFGIASVIMGFVVGSLMGYDLKELPGIGEKILIRNNDQIFNFALLLGVIQILFGIGISAVKKMHQSGFVHGLTPIGTFLFIGALSFFGAAQLGTDISAVAPYLKYPMWGGLALILLFNQPGKNPIINILGGFWLLYNIVTGFFGDILSYIRLFALGVSSAILGFVVNSIGAQMSGTPVIGPIIFIVFMLFGHGLNLALGGLSGFVHPMRLTFVEFFKNAAFEGPGTPYKPFAKH